MLKNKNKALLKKIYQEEYEKALAKEKTASLNREIERIKKMAREKARRKTASRSDKLKRVGSRVKKHRKTVKHYGDTALRIRDNLLDLL